jgi:hypothetical protein
MGKYRTYFSKNNTLVRNSYVNTARNPIVELYYGFDQNQTRTYSRYIFDMDLTNINNLYTGKTFTSLNNTTHKLKMKNCSSFDELFGEAVGSYKTRGNSFDLILFKISGETWDQGIGYDYADYKTESLIRDPFVYTETPSNWFYNKTNSAWNNPGVYTTPEIIATQHFDLGNEDLEIDISTEINNRIQNNIFSGVSYGIAFTIPLENIPYSATTFDASLQYVGFFSKYTQTFYQPYLETVYDNLIQDDRNFFYKGKLNNLFLYVNKGGIPINLDSLPTCTINDMNGTLYSSFTATQKTVGVYYVSFVIPDSYPYDSVLFNDVWSNLYINGIQKPNATLDFEVKCDEYFSIGSNEFLPKEYGLSFSGLKRDEVVSTGEKRKVVVSVREPYVYEVPVLTDFVQYRIYVKEGPLNEIIIQDWYDLNRTTNMNYFMLDTSWLLPNKYYLDIRVSSNQEIREYKEITQFFVRQEL